MATRPRQNYHEESEAGVNKQINLHLYSSYTYHSMAMYFDRDDVALPGFHKFFKKASDEEQQHAEKLLKFQNERGGRIKLTNIKAPDQENWGTGLDAMQAALELEKNVNQSLLALHKTADKHDDTQMGHFIKETFLDRKVETIKELADHAQNLIRVGRGVGEFMFDKKTLDV